MPTTITHALIPLAGTLAFAKRPVPWRLVFAASFAAAAPDLDTTFHRLWGLSASSIYSHRGATHSLFTALAAGLAGCVFHKHLRVKPLTAAVVIAAAAASHGLLDMLTDSGRPVAYLWPLSSERFFAAWRPIHSSAVHMSHFFAQGVARLKFEGEHLVGPMFATALIIRAIKALVTGHLPFR